VPAFARSATCSLNQIQAFVARAERHFGRKDYALSVSNDGPALPEGFDPVARKGLGMRIVRSLVELLAVNCELIALTRTKARDLRCCFDDCGTNRGLRLEE
jgi:two-component sensor histidine kinase